MKKILLFSNTSWSLYNFRKNLIIELVKSKNEVVIISKQDYTTTKLKKIGCKFYNLSLERRGDNILNELLSLYKVYKLIKLIKPNILFNFTIKPIVYGSFISRILEIKTLNTLDGLGASLKLNFIKKIILLNFLRVSQKKVSKFFFVNLHDKNFFLQKKILEKKNIKLINGTGIDLDFFKFKKNSIKNKIKFLLISRLIFSKGVMNYLNAILKLPDKYKKVSSFSIVGLTDKNLKDSIPKKILESYAKKSNTKIKYDLKNIKSSIYNSNCIVLPTYYNEGLPRTLLEAASIGRPIITTNISGCKRIAKNNKNAFIYSIKKPDHLKKQIINFILLKNNKKIEMSRKSREIAKKFDEKKIITLYINFVNER
ncbi:MAG: hypothetical protein CBD97_02460 [Pelagibacteraceae bacterium TMED237]|nr:MAG: hypothetical protein CBD97_02460 [Pelagibacteraceae bacterium TMED237]|tara:strand:- start:6815 stop:7921 length:1107 start_codon:yes stop_codon:yes gene_type:complete